VRMSAGMQRSALLVVSEDSRPDVTHFSQQTYKLASGHPEAMPSSEQASMLCIIVCTSLHPSNVHARTTHARVQIGVFKVQTRSV
jgi:hypothetical protein